MQRQVHNAIDAGEGDLVAKRLRERITAEPNNEEARIQLADHYRKTGAKDLAIEHLRVASERFPRSERTILLLAETLHEQNQAGEAIRHLESFLNSQSSASAAAWLGILRDQQGSWKSGESAHRAALAAAPENARVRNNLGYNLLQQGRRQEAIAELRRAVTQDPKLVAAHNNLAFALARGSQQERREALAEWSLAAGMASAHSNLAASLIEQGAYTEARQQLQLALGLRPDLPQALHNLKLVAELDGRPAQTGVVPQGASASALPPAKKDAGLKAAMKKVWFVVAGVDRKPAGPGQPSAGSE
ncbi:MAG: tetratricopeptide repeat protein [Bryobacterales bacterium]|nr:tetratricopeptide repeat protein [Bryobacterales bacterium]